MTPSYPNFLHPFCLNTSTDLFTTNIPIYLTRYKKHLIFVKFPMQSENDDCQEFHWNLKWNILFRSESIVIPITRTFQAVDAQQCLADYIF